MGDQTVGLQARMMSQAMRKLAGNLNRTQTMCLFTNQIREKVGVMFGSPETQPGGRALKFYSSQRLDIRRIETLKEGTEAVGNRVRVKVVKNKVAAPFRQAEFDIEFGKGISTSGCILDLGIEHGIVTKSGSFFSYGDERLGQGRNNAKAFLDEHPEMAREIEAKIYEVLGVDRDLVAPDRARSGRDLRGALAGRRRLAAGREDRPRRRTASSTRSTSPTATSAGATARWSRCAGTSRASAWSRAPSTPRCGAAGRRLPRRRALRAALRRGPAGARRLGRRPHRAAAAGRGRRGRGGRGGARRARRRRRARRGRRAAAPRSAPPPDERPRARARARDPRPQGLRAGPRLRRRASVRARARSRLSESVQET